MLPMFVTLDVSKVSGWLNANAPCRVERRAYDAWREIQAMGGGRAWGGGSGASSLMHGEGPTEGWEARARAERTKNIPYMFLTPDVDQLEMSALKSFKPLKR